MSLAVLSIFTATFAVSAKETAEAESEAVLSDEADAELMAIKEVAFDGVVYECDNIAKTAIAISVYLPSATSVTIPETVKYGSRECAVIEIADGFCNGHESVKNVDISRASNLTKIGENCFSYCPELTEVTFESISGLVSIGNNCFYYCPKLSSVKNTDKQPSLREVGSSVFGLTPYMDNKTDEFVMLGKVLLKYNGTDTEVTVPTGTVGIADAFFGSDIVSIDLGTTVTNIGNNAFYGCRSLKSVSIPASCTKIGDMAFAGCSSLEKVEYAGALSSIGFCSFANCGELQEFKYTGSGSSALTNIGECAFWNARKLTKLDSGTIANINVGSFWNCFGEGSYYRIPESVISVAEGGYGNLNFNYVTIPENITALASTAFGSTDGATYVIVKGSAVDEYFKNSGYKYIFYGDMNADGKIIAEDIKTIAGYIAKGINDLNYDNGRGVIADKHNDGNISMLDLFEVFRSIKEDIELEQAQTE